MIKFIPVCLLFYVLTCVSVIFFLIYLLSHNISRRIRQCLILLCEAHFALLYILQFNLISNTLEQKGSLSKEVLSQLGMTPLEKLYQNFFNLCMVMLQGRFTVPTKKKK